MVTAGGVFKKRSQRRTPVHAQDRRSYRLYEWVVTTVATVCIVPRDPGEGATIPRRRNVQKKKSDLIENRRIKPESLVVFSTREFLPQSKMSVSFKGFNEAQALNHLDF